MQSRNDTQSLTIRKIKPAVKEGLKARAKLHGHSMEEEARQILEKACKGHSSAFDQFRSFFSTEAFGPLELPERGSGREPPTL